MTRFVGALACVLSTGCGPAPVSVPPPPGEISALSSGATSAAIVAVDATSTDELFVLGDATGAMTLGGATLTGSDTRAFAASLGRDGHASWLVQVGDAGETASDLSVTADGADLWVILEASDALHVLILSGADGSVRRERRMLRSDAGSATRRWRVATGELGEAWIAGTFEGQIDVAEEPFFSEGATDGLVACVLPDLSSHWAHTFGTAGVDTLSGLAVDEHGMGYVVGLGPGAMFLDTPLGEGPFLLQIDPTGSTSRVTPLTAAAGESVVPQAIVASAGRAWVAGLHSRPSMEGSELRSFVSAVDVAGAVRWTTTTDPTGSYSAWSLAVDGLGRAVTCGTIAAEHAVETSFGAPITGSDGDFGYVRVLDETGRIAASKRAPIARNVAVSGCASGGSVGAWIAGASAGSVSGLMRLDVQAFFARVNP